MKTEDSIKFAEIINQRQWYERPGPSDRFSDGSAVVGRQPKLNPRATQTCLEITDVLTSRARKLPYNPPAGDIRRKDLSGSWMSTALRLQDGDNAKTAVLLQQKRELNLAKQSVAGLKTINVSYDVTELSIIFRLAYRYTDQRTSEEAQKPDVQRALAVLDAALKFDMKKLAAALGLQVKRAKTFGYLPTSPTSKAGGNAFLSGA